jgi:dTDP-4-dehydrorhamnose 3,5-epimerase
MATEILGRNLAVAPAALTSEPATPSLRIEPLKFSGMFKVILQPQPDERGYFVRVFDKAIFQAHGLCAEWAQENQSYSLPNVVRGLHFQGPPCAEAKLVRVLAGSIVDFFVDLRRSSSTYGQWDSIALTAENHIAVYIPQGVAHGFCTPRSAALLDYKIDLPYAPAAAGGLRWNDPDLHISWPVENPIVSDRDRAWPAFRDFVSPFA